MEEKPTYPANRDARAQLTEIESATSRRVHRLDRICGNKPAKLLDFKSLTLRSGSSRFGPVYLYIPFPIWTEVSPEHGGRPERDHGVCNRGAARRYRALRLTAWTG